MPARQKEGTLSMPQTIEYEEKHFIIVNDIENSLFYFFDFDVRSTEKNMEFEHLHSYYEPMISFCWSLPACISPFIPVKRHPRDWSSPLCTATMAMVSKTPMKIF